METFNVLDTQVTVAYTQIQDMAYATSVHVNRFALEAVVPILQDQGWLLDELVNCGNYWSLSMVMDTGVIIL